MTTRTLLSAKVSAVTGSTPKQMDGVAVEFPEFKFKAEAPGYVRLVVPTGATGVYIQCDGGMFTTKPSIIVQNVGTVSLGLTYTPASFTGLFSGQTTTAQKMVLTAESIDGDGGEIAIINNLANDVVRDVVPTSGTTEGLIDVWIGGK